MLSAAVLFVAVYVAAAQDISQPLPAPRFGRANGDQQPKWLDALLILRGGKDLTTEEQRDILNNAVAGQDYPINAYIPDSATVDCASYKQAGYYADVSAASQCQVFHYCSLDGQRFDFLCPNQTVFNQITLVCDWFFNIDCSKSYQFIDYSNSRLYHEDQVLLDDQLVYPSNGYTNAPYNSGATRAPAAYNSRAPVRVTPRYPQPPRTPRYPNTPRVTRAQYTTATTQYPAPRDNAADAGVGEVAVEQSEE